jgi:GntR family transcriptional regulator / MocR family aminotransferase
LADGNESALTRQSAWRRLAVEGLELFRHPDTEADRDGLVIGYAAPAPSAWSGALEALTRLLP